MTDSIPATPPAPINNAPSTSSPPVGNSLLAEMAQKINKNLGIINPPVQGASEELAAAQPEPPKEPSPQPSLSELLEEKTDPTAANNSKDYNFAALRKQNEELKAKISEYEPIKSKFDETQKKLQELESRSLADEETIQAAKKWREYEAETILRQDPAFYAQYEEPLVRILQQIEDIANGSQGMIPPREIHRVFETKNIIEVNRIIDGIAKGDPIVKESLEDIKKIWYDYRSKEKLRDEFLSNKNSSFAEKKKQMEAYSASFSSHLDKQINQGRNLAYRSGYNKFIQENQNKEWVRNPSILEAIKSVDTQLKEHRDFSPEEIVQSAILGKALPKVLDQLQFLQKENEQYKAEILKHRAGSSSVAGQRNYNNATQSLPSQQPANFTEEINNTILKMMQEPRSDRKQVIPQPLYSR